MDARLLVAVVCVLWHLLAVGLRRDNRHEKQRAFRFAERSVHVEHWTRHVQYVRLRQDISNAVEPHKVRWLRVFCVRHHVHGGLHQDGPVGVFVPPFEASRTF